MADHIGMEHRYTSRVIWTGNRGDGTARFRGYARTWDIAVSGKAVVHCSNDPLLGGDPTKMNPEDLLLSALSACHMLWYLRYASGAGIVVSSYEDNPEAIGEIGAGDAGRFVSAVLRPRVTINADADLDEAIAIHHRIRDVCFVARSVNFPVSYEPVFETR